MLMPPALLLLTRALSTLLSLTRCVEACVLTWANQKHVG